MELKEYKIKNNKLSGKKIIHLSDFHNTRNKKKIKFIIENINNIKPDLIFITGDLFDYYFYNKENADKLINSINNIPIYMVLGNHEERLKKDIDYKNVVVLNNKNIIIDNINLIGINSSGKSINKLIDNNYYNILLVHKPNNYFKYNVDLVLCGHTHGSKLNKYSKGLYEKNNTKMIVNSGISSTTLHIRFSKSSIVLIDFI